MKSGTTVVKDETKSIERAVSALLKNRVYVGIPADKNARTDGPIGNAALGYIHETGSPARNIPERPWLVPGMRTAQKEFTAQLRTAARDALKGSVSLIDKHFHAVGALAQTAVKAFLVKGDFARLAERTLEGRRARGNMSEKPLIDTTKMYGAVTYAIRKYR